MTLVEEKGAPADAPRPAWENAWGRDERGPYVIATKCGACGRAALGLRDLCPYCGAADAVRAERVGRRGTVYTATTLHQVPQGFAGPYRAGYVDIEDGLRIFAHVDPAAPIGGAVALELRPLRRAADGAWLEGPFYRSLEA